MSVVMTLSVNRDPKKLEEHAASDPVAIQAILEPAKEHGPIAHGFYGSEDGQIRAQAREPRRVRLGMIGSNGADLRRLTHATARDSAADWGKSTG